jgi:predicted dehydrogenase
MKTSLIVGMGIGNLYATVLNNLGHGIITVDADPNKKADFTSVDDAIEKCQMFDTVHICTPNFTHEEIARKLAPVSRIVFIEKPGVKDSNAWLRLLNDFPKTRFMMVKNNMWRKNIKQMQKLAKDSKSVYIDWINKDRVPNPGTWFTTKELAYGGVSRDLMPHLLSLFIALEPEWLIANETNRIIKQQWQLEDLTKTDYGVVKADGTYDVDDYFGLSFTHNIEFDLLTNWRSMEHDQRQITFNLKNGKKKVIELGLCPEEAYQAMIKDAVKNKDNDEFWKQQMLQDYWIHKRIENL